MYKFTIKQGMLRFDDYVQRDLDASQTGSGDVEAKTFNWNETAAGLVLGIESMGVQTYYSVPIQRGQMRQGESGQIQKVQVSLGDVKFKNSQQFLSDPDLIKGAKLIIRRTMSDLDHSQAASFRLIFRGYVSAISANEGNIQFEIAERYYDWSRPLNKRMFSKVCNFIFKSSQCGYQGTELTSDSALWDANLISAWHMNIDWDDAKGSNDGTRYGTGTAFDTSNQKLGTAAGQFNGSDDYVSVTHDSSLDLGTGDFSILAWIKVGTQAAGDRDIVGKLSGDPASLPGFYFRLPSTDNDKFYIIMSDGTDTFSIISTADVTDGTWHQVVAVIDRDNAANSKLYLDGVDISGTKTGTITNVDSINNTDALSLGGRATGPANLLDGFIDEVAIWKRTLSGSEISGLYNEQMGTTETWCDKTLTRCTELTNEDNFGGFPDLPGLQFARF